MDPGTARVERTKRSFFRDQSSHVVGVGRHQTRDKGVFLRKNLVRKPMRLRGHRDSSVTFFRVYLCTTGPRPQVSSPKFRV